MCVQAKRLGVLSSQDARQVAGSRTMKWNCKFNKTSDT